MDKQADDTVIEDDAPVQGEPPRSATRKGKSDAGRSSADLPLRSEQQTSDEAKPEESPKTRGKTYRAPAVPLLRRRRRLAVLAAVCLVLSIGAYFGYSWFVHGRFIVSTNDAYVRADMSILAPRVSGYVASVAVKANAFVKAGEVLVRIEAGDYELAVQAAAAKIATQDATIARIGKQLEAEHAMVAQAHAQLLAVRADARRAVSDFERTQRLTAKNFSSRKLLDTARADRDRTAAEVLRAKAQILAAKAKLEVLAAQRAEGERVKAELATARRRAKRDLDATLIRAPFAGVVGNQSAKVGQYVKPGTRLLALVPLDRVYVIANFKETQIARLKVGQKVHITVDAYSEREVIGRIESFSPAAGSQFSLLPPDNATGNFTKIVQRLPVRISVPAEIAKQGYLRPGMSVVVDVETRSNDGAGGSK